MVDKVQPGDPLSDFTAAAHNLFVDAGLDYLSRVGSLGSQHKTTLQPGQVWIKNISGADRNRFDVLGVNQPLIDSNDALGTFKDEVILECDAPGTFTGDARANDLQNGFVVLAETIADQKIGRAWISGICPVQVSLFGDSWDGMNRWCDIESGVTGNLVCSPSGSARILWYDQTGGIPADKTVAATRWAVVHLNAPGQRLWLDCWATLTIPKAITGVPSSLQITDNILGDLDVIAEISSGNPSTHITMLSSGIFRYTFHLRFTASPYAVGQILHHGNIQKIGDNLARPHGATLPLDNNLTDGAVSHSGHVYLASGWEITLQAWVGSPAAATVTEARLFLERVQW